MVEPAWAVAEIATSGNKRAIVRRWLVDMSGSLMFESAVMCASNHEFGADCQPVTGSRRRENKSVQGTILPVRPHRMDRITVRVGSLLPSAERVTAICIEPPLSHAFHDAGDVN